MYHFLRIQLGYFDVFVCLSGDVLFRHVNTLLLFLSTLTTTCRRLCGGFAFLETGASLQCEGTTIRRNHAGDQGGGIYARDDTLVHSSCD